MSGDPSTPEEDTTLPRLAAAAVRAGVAIAAVSLACGVVIAVAHVHDTYNVDHVSGTWIGLAAYLNHGTFYPPLFEDGVWGGTRYMPLSFVLHAGVARITGEYLVSGKLVAYALAVLLLMLAYRMLRRRGTPRAIAFMLVSTLVAAPFGLRVFTGIHGDTLSVVLQLAALELVAVSAAPAVAAAAGALCALAFLSKLTALWAAVAIAAFLVRHDRRRLVAFATGLFALTASVSALFEILSHGRFLDNVFGLSFSGSAGPSALVLDAPQRIVGLLERDAAPVWAMFPLTLLALGLAAFRRSATLEQLALLAALAILLVVETDIGTGPNHLLDVAVLAVIVVGGLWRLPAPAASPLLTAVVALVAIWGIGTPLLVTEAPEAKRSLKALIGHGPAERWASRPIARDVPAGATILSEDPYLPISRGELPAILDPFMLLRIDREHPHSRDELLRRIEHRAYDRVILLRPADPADPWYRDIDLGRPVVEAIDRSYRLERVVQDYWRALWIYAPR